MWFSNLQLFRLTKPFSQTPEELAELLEPHAFKPCGALDLMSYGWVSPLGRNGTELIHAANGRIMICARKEQKILPATVIRERVQEKAEQIEAAQARPVRRKERQTIKDEVILDLLPKAFPRSSLTFAYISPKEGLIVVNASGIKKAEELLSALRSAIGSLPAVSLSLNVAPSATMTQWLNGEGVPHDVALGDECELRDVVEDGGIIRCKRQDLTSDEIQVHLDAGKRAVKLAIDWQEQISCIINDDLSVKRLRFSQELLDQYDEAPDDDPAAAFDNDFAIMTLELSKFIPRLIEIFGGENEAAYS